MTEDVFVLPASFAQQRLWFLDMLEPGSAFYTIRDTIVFDQPVDHAALERALNAVVQRHEALRTSFASVDGRAVQVVARSSSLMLPEADLRQLAASEREAEADRIASEEFERPFDLARGPLLRAFLLRLSDQENLLLLTLHHIVADGWSLGVLSRDLRELYEADTEGRPPSMPPLPIQYADYALWHKKWLIGDVLTAQLDYWKKRLADLPTVLKLPVDRGRPPVQSYAGAGQMIHLSRSLSDDLTALAKRQGVTPFMCLLAGFLVLLHRYTGEEDVVVGTPVAGRTRPETEQLVGFFANTLVIRADLSGDPTFRELLERVRDVALGAYAHQDVPFEKLVEVLQPERSLGHHPLFQVMFQLLSAQDWGAAGPSASEEADIGSDDEPVAIEGGTAKFDLGVDVFETAAGLAVAAEYRTDLFEDDTIRRMLSNFKELLSGIAAHPDRRLSRLPLLTSSSYAQVIAEWNDTGRDFPEHECIHGLFERQADAEPDRLALVAQEGELTYGELNARANRIARHLRRAGVGVESLVGLCIERSQTMLAGLLGILKAGGAYVPLDPTYPKERLAFMLADAGVSVVLTEAHMLEDLPESQARFVCLDRDAPEIARESPLNLAPTALPRSLAYVIYTSGSTGTPKGVMIEHRSLVSWTTTVTDEYGLRADDRILQFASLSFDTAAEEIFPCLTRGATLCLRSPAMAASIPGFLEECRARRLTVLDLPTAFWHELTWEIAAQGWRLPPSVRLVIVGGERMLPDRLAMWHRTIPKSVRLMQGYGPTEVTVVATIADLSAGAQEVPTAGEASIGRAIGNARTYVLDPHAFPVARGVAGELYVGGEGLARGYRGRPGLTGEKFLPDPFSGEAGGRLYRTGDLVRQLANGELEFLGRCDGQVKIRGYRIEPGEVEALLREEPGVKDAVVTAVAGTGDSPRLVAFVIADHDDERSVAALGAALRARIPAFMVPSTIVPIEALPLTAQGKVDRAALQERVAQAALDRATSYVAPGNETERVIASVWQDVFEKATISVDSNFFDLGGHSLTLVRVRSRLHEFFQGELSMVDMFRFPTIRSLAEHLDRSRSVVSAPAAPEVAAQVRMRGQKQRKALRRRPLARVRSAGDE